MFGSGAFGCAILSAMKILRATGATLSALLLTGSIYQIAVRGQDAPAQTPAPRNAPGPVSPSPARTPRQQQLARPILAWQRAEKWPVNAVCFSPDGKTLATGGQRGQVRLASEHAVKLWETATGRLLRTFVAANTSIDALSFSPDGKLLAGGGTGRTLLLWEVATGVPLKKLPGHTDWVKTVVFSPDGKTLASGGVDNTIRLWDVTTGQQKRLLTVPDKGKQRSLDHYSVHGLAFSPDGHTLAAAYFYNGAVRLWDANSGQLLRTLPSSTNAWAPSVTSVAFSPDGQTLACGQGMAVLSEGTRDELEYGGAVLWEAKSGRRLGAIRGHHFFVKCLDFSPDGTMLLTGGDEGTVRLHNLETRQTRHILHGRKAPGNSDWRQEIEAVDFSPDGHYLAGTDTRGRIKVWRLATK